LKRDAIEPNLDVSEKHDVVETLRDQTSDGLGEVLSLILMACDVSVAGVVFYDERLKPYQQISNRSSGGNKAVEVELKHALSLSVFTKKEHHPWITQSDIVEVDPKLLQSSTRYKSAFVTPIVNHKYEFIGGIVLADEKLICLSEFQQRFIALQSSQLTRELILRFALSREIDLHEKLNERKRMLRMVLDNVPAKIWFKDDKNNVLRLNELAAKSSGQTVKELEGKNSSEIWPDMAKQYYKEDLAAFQTGQPQKGIIQHYTHKNGKSGWISTDKIPFYDEETGQKFILVVSMDITKLRNYQRQISRDSERLELIGSSSNVGLWDWPIFNEDKIWWSPVFHEMMGDPERKIKPTVKIFQSAIHPEDLKLFDATLAKYMENYKPFSLECRVKSKDEAYRWYLISGQSSSTYQDKNKRIIGSMTDIHDMKTIQLNYDIERQKLAEAYKELDSFAYVASHDLKGPLRGMSNVIDWIREDIQSEQFESITDHLNLLESRVDRLDVLLKDILSFSKAGKTITQAENVDMQILVDNIIDWMPISKDLKVEVIGKLPVLKIQKTIAEQVFSNLISNAVKHNDTVPGVVSISCEETYFDYKFLIKDNGPGIKDEYRGIIFEPFKRLVTKDDIEGSGLGLSIVQKVLKSINGLITIKPYREGEGTCVELIIPKISVGV